jgi:hypothetical protein
MARQTIDIGTNNNDGTGDKLRDAMRKVNENFAELYGQSSAETNLSISGNTITVDNTNGDLSLEPNGSGELLVTTGATFNTSEQPLGHVIVKADDGSNVLTVNTQYKNVGVNTTANVQGLSVGGNLIVDGTSAIFNSNMTLGSDTTNTVNFVAKLGGNIIPATHNTSTLGTSSLKYQSANIGNITSDLLTTANITATNTTNLVALNVTGDTNAGNLLIRDNQISNNIADQDIEINPYGSGNLVVNTRMVVGQGSSPIGNAIIKAVENVVGYVQLTLQNLNSGASSSADIFVPRDDGDDLDNYFDLGINSSNYSDPIDYPIHSPGSAYLYTASADLFVGTANTATDMVVHAGGLDYSNITFRVKGNTGHIILGPEDGSTVVTDTGEHLQVKDSARFSGTIAIAQNAPSTAVGAAGDETGMIAWNSSYIYVCTGNYDGSTHIWKRSSLGSW